MATAQPAGGIPPIRLHHRLAIAMEHAGVKRAEMCELLGVSGNTVSNYTNGNTRPSTSTLRVWALRCGVPFEWLAHGIESSDDGPDGPTEQDGRQSGCKLYQLPIAA